MVFQGNSNRLTVIQVIPRLDSGGAERGAVDVVRALVQAGHRAIIIAEGGRLVKEVLGHGGEFIAMPVASKSPLQIWKNAKHLEQIIKETGASLIHARSRAPAWSAYLASKRTGIPFVTTYHGLYKAKSTFKKWYNGIMAKGDAVIAVSHFIGDHIAANHPYAQGKVTVIPRGVDTARYVAGGVSRLRIEAMIKSWGLSDDLRRIILLPGRVSRIKGHLVLVEATHLLLKKRSDFVCVCLGDDQGKEDYNKELEKTIRKYNLQPYIRFVGHTLDMPAAYAVSDVVVVPSTRPEAFGRIPIEAQIMGRPVIAAAHGGACETIQDKVTGFLVPPSDAKAMAESMDYVLDMSDEEKIQMARLGRQSVEELYQVDKMCASTLTVYQNIVQKFVGLTSQNAQQTQILSEKQKGLFSFQKICGIRF